MSATANLDGFTAIELCPDCVMLVANDEAASDTHRETFLANLGIERINGTVVIDDFEDMTFFRAAPCVGCGALAGDRYPATIWAD